MTTRFIDSTSLNKTVKGLIDHVKELGNVLTEDNKKFVFNLFERDEAVLASPDLSVQDTNEETALAIRKSYAAWWETDGVLHLLRDESDVLLNYLFNLVTQNHDAQVRFKWRKNDMAIWDNRSTWHCATYDYVEARTGDRVCSLGEAPYLDIASKSR